MLSCEGQARQKANNTLQAVRKITTLITQAEPCMYEFCDDETVAAKPRLMNEETSLEEKITTKERLINRSPGSAKENKLT